MAYRRLRGLLLVLLIAVAGSGCAAAGTPDDADLSGRPIRVTATTNIVTDLARVIGGSRAEVTALMGPGVDPHLFKASAGDVRTLRDADLILYGGLELEGRMEDLLEEIGRSRPTVAVTRDMPREKLLPLSQSAGLYDPHVWFDVRLWQAAARTVADAYGDLDPAHADEYQGRLRRYLAELERLDAEVRRDLGTVPPRSRVLVTSHDAFAYFGEAYGFEVAAIQGTSTQTEATTADIERIARLIAERRIRSVFVESSVPRQTIDAVLASAAERGQRAEVGGELYSDAAGDEGTVEGTYVGMVRRNVELITEGLR